MAAFSSLLGLLRPSAPFHPIRSGKLLIEGIRGKKDAEAPLAPGPIEPLTPPKPPTVLPGANEALAQAAGQRQRKRAVQGSILTRPTAPVSSLPPMAARSTRKSLIGGSY